MALEWLLNVLTNQEERQKMDVEKLRELEAEFIKIVLENEEPMIF
jgi:hypothetical protein